MQAPAYRVRLDAFEGPLDLLLYLIRRAEVDVHDIPITTITDQYLAHLEDIGRIDIDTAGEFLVMAATLMEIKSRVLQPPEEGAEGEAQDTNPSDEPREDPRAELVRQLLEYRKHRSAADELDARRQAWASRFPVKVAVDDERVAEALEDMGELDLDDVDVLDLAEAFRSIIASVDFSRLGDHAVVSDDTPIEIHAEDIVSRLADAGEARTMTLRKVLDGRTRAEMVGLFLPC